MRYDSYKDSGVEWLGEVPSHWEEFPLFTQAKISSVINHTDKELLSVYLDKGVIKFSDVDEKRTNVTSLDLSKYQLVQKGNFVLNNQQAWRGSVGVSNYVGIVSPAYLVLELSNKFSSDYANYLFRNGSMVAHYLIASKGVGTIQRNLYWGNLRRVPVFYSPLSEQTAIAQYLDDKTAKIDRAIALEQQQIELLKERKQIVIQTAVTRGLNPDVAFKDSGVEWLGEVPEHWEVKKLKHLTSKIGSGITPNGGALTYLENGIPLLRSQNIHFDKIDLNNVAKISQQIHNSMANSKVKKGDVLLNITGGSLGRCFYNNYDFEMNVNQHVCIIRPNKKINTIFLNMLLASNIGQEQIWFFQQGGGREGLNFQALKNFYFAIPPLSEQTAIAQYLDEQTTKIDHAISIKLAQIDKLKEYKTVLINEVVTGKRRVLN